MKNPKVQGRYRGVQPYKRAKVKKSARVKDRREKALAQRKVDIETDSNAVFQT
jgi:hypothetical protein